MEGSAAQQVKYGDVQTTEFAETAKEWQGVPSIVLATEASTRLSKLIDDHDIAPELFGPIAEVIARFNGVARLCGPTTENEMSQGRPRN